MKKEDILNILNEEIMIVEDQAGNKITCVESCDFGDIADAILRLRSVSRSIGLDTKPRLMTATESQCKENGGVCKLCIYRKNSVKSYNCRKCINENGTNQYYG